MGSRIFNFFPASLSLWLARAVLACLAIGTDAPACGQSIEAEVAQAVRELKSDRFEDRQQATRKLFNLGPEILPALEKIERSASLEQNQRLENLKVVFRAINAGQTSPVARRAWLDFNEVGPETRALILDKLLTLNEYEAHFALLEQLPSPHIHEVFEDNDNYYSLIVGLCRSEQWELIDRLLSMPLMWEFQPILCARFHFLMGTLDDQITQLRKRLNVVDPSKNKFRVGRDLETVIELLIFQRQYDAAKRYIAKIPQERLRLEAENELLFERGDWKELASRAVLADSKFDKQRPYIACSPWEYVLLKQYGEGVQAGAKAIDEIEAAQRESGNLDELDEGMLAALSMLTCDWEKAKSVFDSKPNANLLRLLSDLNRTREMEELIGAGVTFESRSKWAKERRDEIGKLIKKLKRESARPRNSQKRRDLTKEIYTEAGHYIYVCQHWLNMGLEEEVILYLREVHVQLHDLKEKELERTKNAIVETICRPGRVEATWSFLQDAGFSDSQLASMAGSGAIFGDEALRKLLAQFLNGALYDSIKNPMERLQRISFLLNSSLKPTDPETVNELYPDGFDLDTELARIRHDSTHTRCWQISQIYQYHGRHREALQWKELAALKGQANALLSLAEEALDEGKFTNAARMFDAHFSESSKAYSLGLSSHAWKMAGEEQIAKRRMFYASVVQQHYGASIYGFYRDFIDDERGAWVSDLARLDTIVATELSLYHQVNTLNSAKNCWKLADPVECANFGKRLMLKTPGNSLELVARFNVQCRTHDVMSAVESRDFDAVKSIFDQLNQFSLGSPSLVENIVPRLDELGQGELADYITQQTALFFEDVLVRYPNSPVNRNNYAWLLACAKRRLDTVLRHAELAVQLQPQEHTYIDTLAESHFARGEYDKAIEVIQRSIMLDPPRRYYRNQLKKYQDAKAGK